MIYSGRIPYGTNQVQSSSLAITVENTDVAVFTTGSLLVSGSLTSLGGFTGSFSGSFTGSANFTTLTSSNALITGNVIVLGTASINTLVINQTQLSTGSNQLGDNADDFQTLFGTVRIPTGSLTVTGSTIISSSAATQLQVGSNSLFVSSSGRVGIGTTTPAYNLDVYQANVKAQIRTTAENQNATLFFGTNFDAASLPKTAIIAQGLSSWSRSNLHFCLSTNDINNAVEATLSDSKMVILNGGNVGIGTTAPSFKLDVSGSGRFSGNLTVTGSATNSLLVRGSGATSATTALLVQNSAGNTSLQVLDSRDVYVPSNLSSSGTFTAGQNTGISYNHNLYAGLGSVNITRLDTYVSTYTLGVGSSAFSLGNNNSQLYVFAPSGWGTNATLARFATSDIRTSAYMIDVGNGGSTTTVGSMARFHTIDPFAITVGGSTTQSFTGLDIKFKGQTANYSQPVNTSISSILFNNELNNFGFGVYTAYLGVKDIDISSSYANFASPYTAIDVRPRFTGTPSGSNTYVGININPTLGAGYNFIALRTLTGSVLFNGGNVGIGTSNPNYILDVSGSSEFVGNVQITGSTFISASAGTGSALTVYKSGSTVVSIQGSQGELFSITDSLSGSLFSVSNISGLPILEVFSDNTTLVGNYLDPMLVTTQLVTANSGSTTIYSLPTASYDGAFYDYVVRSGSNSRAGQIMAIWSGSSVNYTDNSTTDFGSTANLSFNVIVSGSNMVLRSTVTTGSWTVKTIIRSI
jgi:hypothetical protein